jgi:[lysine-biosynthesis-protein LysW]--L-2-aminoadipate ligase
MEEKWLIEALAEAGVPARALPPMLAPLPVGPVPGVPFAMELADGVAAAVTGVIVDRCVDRVLAAAVTPVLRASGAMLIDAGFAATSNRLEIATLLAGAGIPRPATYLVTSEDVALLALEEVGYPSPFLPLDPGSPEIPFGDRDIAEAVLEHRQVLGSTANTLALVQQSTKANAGRLELLVIGGRVVAFGDTSSVKGSFAEAIELAEQTAAILGASIVGVTIAESATGLVVWDVQAVPEFRTMTAIDGHSLVSSIVEIVVAKIGAPLVEITAVSSSISANGYAQDVALRRESGSGVILSA